MISGQGGRCLNWCQVAGAATGWADETLPDRILICHDLQSPLSRLSYRTNPALLHGRRFCWSASCPSSECVLIYSPNPAVNYFKDLWFTVDSFRLPLWIWTTLTTVCASSSPTKTSVSYSGCLSSSVTWWSRNLFKILRMLLTVKNKNHIQPSHLPIHNFE